MKDTLSTSPAVGGSASGMTDPAIAVFECVNATRVGQAPTSSSRRRPGPSLFQWPIPSLLVRLPCAGRLQPEHLLKAFEDGYDAVCVLACAADNCHCLEGSKRGQLRINYVRGLLDEMGLGGNRLLFFNLPGSAREDMALGLPQSAAALPDQALAAQAQAIVAEAMSAIALLPPSPFRKNRPATEPVDLDTQANEVEESD